MRWRCTGEAACSDERCRTMTTTLVSLACENERRCSADLYHHRVDERVNGPVHASSSSFGGCAACGRLFASILINIKCIASPSHAASMPTHALRPPSNFSVACLPITNSSPSEADGSSLGGNVTMTSPPFDCNCTFR